MAGHKRDDIRDEDITGLKFFDKLLPLFEPLHKIGCQRDKAGNRQLHYDEYCSLLLLFLFMLLKVAVWKVIFYNKPVFSTSKLFFICTWFK